MAVLFLLPDVLALFHWIENVVPRRLGIEQRHVEREHRVVWAAPQLQNLPPLPHVACLSLRQLA